MSTGSDRMTAADRAGRPDCLVEMAMAWLQRPLGGQTLDARAAAIAEICLLISQMRHRPPHAIEIERHRWIERVTVRLCQDCGAVTASMPAIQTELAQRVLQQLLRYHTWREQIAPPVRPVEHTGPSDGGEAAA